MTGVQTCALPISEDAAELTGHAASGDSQVFELALNGVTYHLPVHFSAQLPRGVIGIPVGLRDMPPVMLPGFGRLKPAGPSGEGGPA